VKVLGVIKPEFSDEGHVMNLEYMEGSIIALTATEMRLLRAIQDASDGYAWNWEMVDVPSGNLENRLMDKAFLCIYNWVIAKFAINDFQLTIDKLRDQLECLENDNEL
jgi:hypothetical protein